MFIRDIEIEVDEKGLYHARLVGDRRKRERKHQFEGIGTTQYEAIGMAVTYHAAEFNVCLLGTPDHRPWK